MSFKNGLFLFDIIKGGMTALHWTAENSHTNALKVLCEKGADVNKVTKVSGHIDVYCSLPTCRCEVDIYIVSWYERALKILHCCI